MSSADTLTLRSQTCARVAPVADTRRTPLQERRVFRTKHKLYLATRGRPQSPELPVVNVDKTIARSSVDPSWVQTQLSHGGSGTFLMDMQGIECFAPT